MHTSRSHRFSHTSLVCPLDKAANKLCLGFLSLSFASNVFAHPGHGAESYLQHAIEHAYIVLPVFLLMLAIPRIIRKLFVISTLIHKK